MSDAKLPVVIMVIAMLALGAFVSTICLSTPSPRIPTPTPPPPSQPPPPLSDVTVLLVGVDSLSAAQPNLESFAIIQFHLGIDRVYLTNLSPETIIKSATTSSAAQTLRTIYNWDLPYKRGAVFTQKALPLIYEGLGIVYAEVDFDRQALVQTIGQLEQFGFDRAPEANNGAVPCDAKLSGEALLNRFDNLPLDAANDRLHFQGSILRCLLVSAQRQNWDLATLITTLGKRSYPYPESASAALKNAPALSSTEFTINYMPLDPRAHETPQP